MTSRCSSAAYVAATYEADLADVATKIETRRQFRVPIGSFQALQHRLADMLMRIKQVRSMAYLSAATVDSSVAGDRGRRVLWAAKPLVKPYGALRQPAGDPAARGIGVTDEAPVSQYFKRLTMLELMFGDADHHLARFSDAMPQ